MSLLDTIADVFRDTTNGVPTIHQSVYAHATKLFLVDPDDEAKRVRFDLGGVSSGTTRMLRIADYDLALDGVSALTFIINGNGSPISTGIAGDLDVPYACAITRARALADQVGSMVVDIWKDDYAHYPPTDSDSITASAPITISTDDQAQDTTLSGWNTSLAAGDTLRFNVDSCSTITRCTISLWVRKSG